MYTQYSSNKTNHELDKHFLRRDGDKDKESFLESFVCFIHCQY